MKKRIFRIICLFLTVVFISGCAQVKYILGISSDETPYSKMVYTRPDLVQLQQIMDDALLASQGDNFNNVLDSIYSFNTFYDSYYTNYSLADIRYSGDLTDLYWEEEYRFCVDNAPSVDRALEELYHALAKSPCRGELEGEHYFGPGFFDGYEGENNWDEQFTALLEQEAELEKRYYELSLIGQEYEPGSETYYDACGAEMIGLLTELVSLRQQIAAYWGYDSYPEFAYEFYHYRDYTPAQTEKLLEEIRKELAELYVQVCRSERWEAGRTPCTEKELLDWLRDKTTAMGGTVREAFRLMERAGLYDIGYGENKYNSSFEVYLTSYYEPFIFMNPTGAAYDKLTFAHEFGHFCNDYASYGSYAGTDVAEVFSQGMEYLSLCYGEEDGDLAWVKLADCLCVYVEQAAFAAFEQQMYDLPKTELTEENLRDLYSRISTEYGFESDTYDWEFVEINHYYTDPMYIVSYVVSNDAALQLYQMEQEKQGAGLGCLQEQLDTQAGYFLEFLSEAGLASPFENGRVREVRKTLEDALK